MEVFHDTAAECHLPYGITQCYLLYPSQVNTPCLNPSPGRYLIYLPRRDARLSWPSWLDSAPAGSRTSDLSITSPTLNQCNSSTICYIDTQHTCTRSSTVTASFNRSTPSLFVARRPSTYSEGEHKEIWGRLEVGWEKLACWSTKAAISLKRVKTEEKLLWRAYKKSQTLFRTVLSQTPYGLTFPKIGVSQPNPKTAIAIISRTAKAMDCKFGWYIHRVHPNKSPLKFVRKGSAGVSGDGPIFLSTPYYLRNG